MHLPVLWLTIALLRKSISSAELTCSTTTTSEGTYYKVSGVGETKCDIQWIDADNHMLANSDGKNDSVVVSYNITTLHTHRCYETIMFVLDCYPKPENETVQCVANCSESAGLSDTPGSKEGPRNHLVILPICIILVIFCAAFGIRYCRRQRRNQNGP